MASKSEGLHSTYKEQEIEENFVINKLRISNQTVNLMKEEGD